MITQLTRLDVSEDIWMEHNEGGPWWNATPPPKRHQHKWQTRGEAQGHYVERCACGASSEGDGYWFFIGRDTPRVQDTRLQRLLKKLKGEK